MLNIQKKNLQTVPFPYLVQEQILDPDFYQQLKAAYPTFSRSEGWNRMSADLMIGDKDFEQIVSHGPWKTLYEFFRSDAFLITMSDLFRNQVQANELAVRFDNLRLTDYVETRDWIGSRKVPEAVDSYEGNRSDVFIRMDFGRGLKGYKRSNHLDWRHRICSLLIYFDDPDETDMTGGQFLVNGVKDGAYGTEKIIEPRNNLGIIKLDNNASYHSVGEITDIRGDRKTLYVALSSRGRVW